MKINMPKEANFIIHILQSHGYDTFLVGGCVRDSILGIKPHDWDLCTLATPEEMLRILPRGFVSGGFLEENAVKETGHGIATFVINVENIVTTGIDYGTVTFVINGVPYEVTTFRKECGYSDGRHPDEVKYAKTVEEDLSRRDFTINAMAYNDERGLVDPFGGYDDLKNKVLRCVGQARERMKEDALRILRAIRFASKYKLEIDTDTSVAIHCEKRKLSSISQERISSELAKILCAGNTDILATYPDVISQILPEMGACVGFAQKNPYHQYDVYTHILATLQNCPSDDVIARLALFFHDIGKPKCAVADEQNPDRLHFYGHGEVSATMTEAIMRRMKFDNKTREAVTELVRFHDTEFTVSEKFVRKWLHKIGPEQFERLMDIREADIRGQRKEYREERLDKVSRLRRLYSEMMKKKQCFSLKDLAINGKDLLLAGYKTGPVIGEILNTLLQKVMDGELENDADVLMWYAVNSPAEEKTEETEQEI